MKLQTNKHLLDKQKHVRREKARRRFFILFFLCALLVGATIWGLHRSEIRLRSIEVRGAFIVPAEDILALARTELAGAYAFVLPKDSFLFYPRESLRNSIFEKYLRVAEVAITEDSPRELTITVREREPAAVWCDEKNGELSRVCYYVDAGGLLYDKAPTFSGAVYFEISGSAGEIPRLGSRVLIPAAMARVADLRTLLSVSGITVRRLIVAQGQELSLVTSEGWRLLFRGDSLPDDLVARLKTVLASDLFRERVAEESNPLDYIDLRYGNKLFYKFSPAE